MPPPSTPPHLYVPQGQALTYQLQPMPADTVAGNTIRAGWLLAEMDKASGRRAHEYILAGDQANGGRTVTVGIDAMNFKKPLYVGDLVRIYTQIVRQGRSSITLKTETWADRRDQTTEKVTEGLFTFVAIGNNKRPVEIATNNNPQNPILVPAGSSRPGGAHIMVASLAPVGTQVLKLRPNRRNTNALGDVFGGWILSRMDQACADTAAKIAGYRVANVALEAMTFYKPVFVGDDVTFHTRLARTGTTSLSIAVETWAQRKNGGAHEKVTEGLFTYVAIDKNLKPVALKHPAP